MALTDMAVRGAKPRGKEYKLADGAGLYLLVTPAGGRLWRLKYRSFIEALVLSGSCPSGDIQRFP
jgi:hypothetical protein